MEKINLTLESVRNLLEVAVAERGSDYVYEPETQDGCAYVHGYSEILDEEGDATGDVEQVGDLKPGCMVGHVLINAGVPADAFEQLGINFDTCSDDALRALHTVGYVDYDEAARGALTAAQTTQDHKGTWGAALAHALGV